MNTDKDLIIETLDAAGWKKTDKARIVSMAEMEYDNNQMHLELEHDDSDDSVIFRMFGAHGELFFVAYYEDKLTEWLNALIAIQDFLNEQNYQEYIRQLLPICPLYIDNGEDLIPLTDDDPDVEIYQ
ncbi:MAG: hypothetical protein JW737_06680 [Acidobacteria bacterium]|nr:hypothetical protein [Acidobacteriota bacterium]